MELYLTDKVVLVAGSSKGIGKAIARSFLSQGSYTIITGRNTDSLSQTESEFTADFGTDKVLAIPGDLTDITAIKNCLKNIYNHWGKIDCLIANCGSGRGQTGWHLEESDWQNLFNINLWGSVRLINEVLPAMIEAKQGSIVLLSSITGIEGTKAPLPYSAAKSALINYGKNLALQVGQYNIRVNCVAPGNILFPGGSWEKHLTERPEEVKHYIETEVPLGRFGNPEEIADLVVFLSSSRSSFITGTCVIADGGQTRRI